METSTPIADHGLIGDLQTAALVATDGTIDWFCAPRFDSPSIFAALLDRRAGRPLPDRARTDVDYVTKQLYLPGTPILITRFLSADGVGEVVDFMPIAGDRATDRHRLVRMVRVVRGEMRFRARLPAAVRLRPRRRTRSRSPPTGPRSAARRMTVDRAAPPAATAGCVRRGRSSATDHGVRAVADAATPATSAAWCWRRRRTGRPRRVPPEEVLRAVRADPRLLARLDRPLPLHAAGGGRWSSARR